MARSHYLLSTEIAEYRPIAAALHDLYTRHAGVIHDCTTTKGMQACREARAEIRTCRTSLEAKRKEIKAPALERCRLIDADAKRITEALLAIEDPLDAQVKAEEAAAEERREAKRRAEMERLARLNGMVADIRGWPLAAVGASAQELRELIDSREVTDIGALPAEIREEAAEAKEEALGKLRNMLAARELRDAEEARLAAEREQHERERERQAAEDKRLWEERQRLEEEGRRQEALRQQALREAAAERERWAREQAAERAELDRQRVEHARIERELAEERARIDGLAPHPPPGTWPEPSEPPAPSEAEPGTVMRVRFEKLGGHYHCRVFTAQQIGQMFAKNGELVFDEREWPDIPLLMRGAEFVEESRADEWP